MTVRRNGSLALRLRGVGLVCTGLILAGLAVGQEPLKPSAGSASRPPQSAAEGPRWNQLSAAQRQALGPLQEVWDPLDGPRKRKWLEVAQRFPSMGKDEQRRVHERMGEWVALSPQQRTLARINFRTAKELPASQRLDRWESYQSLSPEERKALAEQAQRQQQRSDAPVSRQPAAVPVSPTTKQVRPGTTTVPVTQRAQPTWHQQPGLPKIATSPRLIDPQTLLPVAGPQGAAATRPAKMPPAAPRPTGP